MSSSPANIYRAVSDMARPLALKAHVDATTREASKVLGEHGIEAALDVLRAAAPRFERLGGLDGC